MGKAQMHTHTRARVRKPEQKRQPAPAHAHSGQHIAFAHARMRTRTHAGTAVGSCRRAQTERIACARLAWMDPRAGAAASRSLPTGGRRPPIEFVALMINLPSDAECTAHHASAAAPAGATR